VFLEIYKKIRKLENWKIENWGVPSSCPQALLWSNHGNAESCRIGVISLVRELGVFREFSFSPQTGIFSFSWKFAFSEAPLDLQMRFFLGGCVFMEFYSCPHAPGHMPQSIRAHATKH
jgi:hypothetical protein